MSNDTLVIIAVQIALFAASYGTLVWRVKTLEKDVAELQVFTGLKRERK